VADLEFGCGGLQKYLLSRNQKCGIKQKLLILFEYLVNSIDIIWLSLKIYDKKYSKLDKYLFKKF